MPELIKADMPEKSADYRALWAKSAPRHPLWKHLLDSAASPEKPVLR